MVGRQIGQIIAIMAVSFMVAMVMLHRPPESGAALLPQSTKGLWQAILPASLSALSKPPSVTQSPASALQPPNIGANAIEATRSEDSDPDLPVLVAVRPIDNGEVDDDGTAARQPGSEHEVDLVNTSDKPLSITVTAVNAANGEQTLAQLLLPPNQRAHLGSESALKLETGYAVTLRSPGYREVTSTVN